LPISRTSSGNIPGEKIWVEDRPPTVGRTPGLAVRYCVRRPKPWRPSLWCRTLLCSAAQWRHLNASRVTIRRLHAG
jgi:hypothetical protein